MEREKEMYARRWIIFLSIGISIFMSTLDGSIVNVALPVISKQLNVSMSTVQWAITIYLITITGVLLPCGRLGDLKGKIKIYKIGVVIFTLGSFFCGISPNIKILILSRIIQGLGAALTMANSVGIIISIFPLAQRGTILGIAALIASLGNMIGPALGGIISNYSWEYIFFINVPLGIISLLIAFKIMPNIKPEVNKGIKLDFIGAILFILSMVPFIVSITEGSIYGFMNSKIIIGFIISIVSFILFIISQLKLKVPLIDFKIFKNNQFTRGVITSFLMFTAINSNLILIPFYFEKAREISPLYSGLFMMSFPIAMTITGPISGYISDKIKKELLPLIGLLSLTSGFICMTTLRSNTPICLVLIYLSLIGAGSGIFQAPMNSIIMSTVDKNKL